MSDALEELFKTTLEKVTVPPPEQVWSRINAHFLAKQRRLRRLFAYSSIAAAIVLLVSFSFFLSVTHKDVPVMLVTRILPGMPIFVTSTPPSSPLLPSPPSATRQGITVSENDIPVTLFPGRTSIGITLNTPMMLALDPMIAHNTIPLINGVAVTNAQKYNQLLTPESPTSPRVPPREEMKIAKRERRTDLKYAVSGYVSPGYSSGRYNAVEDNTFSGSTFENNKMSGIYNINGGLAFAVNTGKRFAVETGIGFSRIGQTVDIKYHTSMSLSPTARNIITPLGNVNNSSKALTVFHDNSEEILEGVRSYQAGTLEQRFDAIDIPLHLRYYVNNTKLKFSIIGGLGAHLLVDNRTYLLSSDSRDNLGATDDIRALNFSARLGLGLEYPITRIIHFKFEPAFKYYLQSISNNSNIDFKPYSLNLSTGFGIRF
jgi:hypothetical protein